jgi:hypothetical protein
MYQKVALKRLSKYCGKGSPEDADRAERALRIDDDPRTRSVIDVPGVTVEPEKAKAQQAQQPLDEVISAARQASNVNAGNGSSAPSAQQHEPRLDRQRLHEQLVDADERWRPHRARVEAWDEIEALSVLSFLRVVLSGDFGESGIPPEQPECMRLEDV